MLRLIEACAKKNDNFYLHVSSQTMKYKIVVQIRPWYLSDASFVLNTSRLFDPRKTIFVGGISGSLKAGKYAYYNCVCSQFILIYFLYTFSVDLARKLNCLYGEVCYAAIHTDEFQYPRVSS